MLGFLDFDLSGLFTTIIGWISAAIGYVLKWIVDGVIYLISAILAPLLKVLLDALFTLLGWIWGGILWLFREGFQWIADSIVFLWNTFIYPGIGMFFSWLTDLLTLAVNSLTSLLDLAGNLLWSGFHPGALIGKIIDLPLIILAVVACEAAMIFIRVAVNGLSCLPLVGKFFKK